MVVVPFNWLPAFAQMAGSAYAINCASADAEVVGAGKADPTGRASYLIRRKFTG
jgi:hypothetical protein